MTQSFNNQSVEEVALTLARRKVGLRHGLVNPMDKLAFDLSSSLQGAGDWFKRQNPVAQKAMIGAGVGGTLGLGSSLFRRGKKHPFRDALTGALAGGTLGGGIGILGNRSNISEELFPSTGDVPGLAKDIEEIQSLEHQSKPSFFNSPLHWAGQTMKEHPVLSTLGIGGGLDVGTGMHIAAQGKNTSPGAWRNVAKALADQTKNMGGIDPTDPKISQIEKVIRSSGGRDAKKILDLLESGDPEDLVTLSKRPDAKKVMQSLQHIDEVYRPMTASQYALQEAHAGRDAFGKPLLSRDPRRINVWPESMYGRSQRRPADPTIATRDPRTWKPLQRGWGKLDPDIKTRLRNFTSSSRFPKSLPNIPKWMRGKGALVGIPAALIASWLAAKGYANTEGAQDKIRDIQQQFGN